MSVKILATLFLAMFSAAVPAAWRTIASEQGRRVEIDRESIRPGPDASLTAKGRIVFDKPIVDPKTSEAYRAIEIESRYDCARRTYATLKRAYYREDDSLLRQDEAGSPLEMPARGGTPDGRLLREVCRPASAATLPAALDKIGELAGDLRKSNETLIARAVKKDRPIASPPARRPSARLAARGAAHADSAPRRAWSYEGDTGPEHWRALSPDYAVCANGRRQSPIDLRDAFAVDLEPIRFLYQPAPFRVVDTGPLLRMAVYGGGIELLGKSYRLTHVDFHSPSEFTIAGQGFDMEAQLFHRADDGGQAVVSILLEKGEKGGEKDGENPAVQAALNNLPLEKGGESAPPGLSVDPNLLLPAGRGYFTFMGSLTTPPCTEGVLWMVLRQPRQISPGQSAMFQRLYPPNARPAQPAFGRIVKESR